MGFVKSLATTVQRLTSSIRVVPIDHCYHYRGFRYGGFGNNLYEDYVRALARGEDRSAARTTFAESVLACRPRTMSEMLGLELGEKPVSALPWKYSFGLRYKSVAEPANNPDIICLYCEKGVLASHINREFRWLEESFTSIRDNGYLPSAYGYARCLELVGETSTSYIVLDGNHRISALHATGARELAVTIPMTARVHRSACHRWPQVLVGIYSASEALQVFDRYFWKANPAIRPMNPARLICDEVPLWRGERT